MGRGGQWCLTAASHVAGGSARCEFRPGSASPQEGNPLTEVEWYGKTVYKNFSMFMSQIHPVRVLVEVRGEGLV